MNDQYSIYIFDLDDTLHHNYKLYPDVKDILTKLYAAGNKLFIASFNSKAPAILKELGIYHLFHGGTYGIGKSKYDMICDIIQFLQYRGYTNYKKISFYDDLILNILEVKIRGKNKIDTIHITDGLKWSLIK
jgi:predicted phosphatase